MEAHDAGSLRIEIVIYVFPCRKESELFLRQIRAKDGIFSIMSRIRVYLTRAMLIFFRNSSRGIIDVS